MAQFCRFAASVLKGTAYALLMAAMLAAVSQNGMADAPGGCDETPCGSATETCGSCYSNNNGQCVTGNLPKGDADSGVPGGSCTLTTQNPPACGNPVAPTVACKDCTCQNPPGVEDPCGCY